MQTDIYYFSGTGNSLCVARELEKNLPDAQLIPVVHLLHLDHLLGDRLFKATADVVGFVFPNFCMTLPIPIQNFLLKTDFSAAQYIFAICTRGGTSSQAFDYMNQILKRQGKRLNAAINITMPWNHPVGKENLVGQCPKEKRDVLEVHMQAKVLEFSQSILRRADYLLPDTEADFPIPPVMKWIFDVLVPMKTSYQLHAYMYQDIVRFYIDADCGGCGTCEKVCLNQKIKLVDGKPIWQNDVKCYGCFACINYCPNHAIQVEKRFLVDSHSESNPRYHHPSVTFKDIAQQRDIVEQR